MKGKLLVEHTNDWSIDSKRSAVEAGYFEDAYIHLFSSKKRRSPLINICYYVRACVVDRALRHFMHVSTSMYQVISLGAGFDTTFLRLFSKEKEVKYIEIDLPSVVKRKVNILLSSEKTKHFFHNWKIESSDERASNNYFLKSDNYIIFSQNLDKIDQLDVRLNYFEIDFSAPTIFLSEVAITYMEEENCTNLCKYLGEKFANSVFLVYEQIVPDDGFGQFMMNHFDTIQSPLKSLTRYNQVKDQSQYYVNQGWQKCLMHRVMSLYESLTPLKEYIEKIRIEPFDEWEEFHLTCLHYALFIASNGSMCNLSESFIGKHVQYNPQVTKQLTWSLLEMKQSIERFGHSIIALDDSTFVMLGGVGVENNCHKKTSLLQMVKLENKEIIDIKFGFSQLALTHMSICRIYVDNLLCFFVYGGCKSPVRDGVSDSFVIQPNHKSAFNLHVISFEEDLLKPCHRWRHTAVSFGRNVYIFGGRTANLNILDDFWKITLTRKSDNWSGVWSELDKGPSGRFSHSCVTTADGSLIISGGIDSNMRPLSDIWKWSSSTGWSQIEINMSIARYGHTSHLVGNKLLLVGGVTLHPSNPGISVINLADFKADNFILPNGNPNYPIMLHNHQSALVEEEQHILVIGGGGNCFSFGTSFNRHIVRIPVHQLVD